MSDDLGIMCGSEVYSLNTTPSPFVKLTSGGFRVPIALEKSQ